MKYAPKFLLMLIIIGMATTGLSACSSTRGGDLHTMALNQMPNYVQMAPVRVQESYQFTAANRDVTEQVPCYCGCVNIGHTSSYDCYIADAYNSDTLFFDDHALNCGICVDITQDVMRLMRDGKSTPEIVNYINDTYSKLGPPTMP